MRSLGLVIFAFFIGCTNVPVGRFSCTGEDDCPSGWVCRADDRCWSTPAEARDAEVDADAGPPDTGADPAEDAQPDVTGDACVPGTVARKLDILFVVDDSGSMEEEQALLSDALPDLLAALTLGDEAFPAVRDIHVGVVNTDLGTAGFVLPTCDGPGGDGILSQGSCDTLPAFLAFPETGFVDFLASTQCRVSLGTMGCGFEQQLEASLKAVAPSTSSLRFETRGGGSLMGHGDGANVGFVRDDSVLLVVHATDESDCSAADSNLFDVDSDTYTT